MVPSRMQIHMIIWQFVHLMTHLEERTNNQYAFQDVDTSQRLLNCLDDFWVELNAKLVDCARSDPAAYADWIMNREIILNGLTNADLCHINMIFSQIINQISLKLQSETNQETVADLSFERDELQILIHRFNQLL